MYKRLVLFAGRGISYSTNFRNAGLRPFILEGLNVNRLPQTVMKQHFHIYCSKQAKGKNIKKEKKKSSFVDEHELSEWLDTEKLFKDFGLAVENFKADLFNYTTLRSSQGAIENLKFEFEGKNYTIQDVAEIGKKNPKIYVLDLSVFPQVIPTVMNTLQKSHLNVNAQQDGTKIFIPIPKITKEHREVLAKKAKVFFLKCKDRIRDTQIKYIKKLKNAESISDETVTRMSSQLITLADKHIHSAEEILKAKENELLRSE